MGRFLAGEAGVQASPQIRPSGVDGAIGLLRDKDQFVERQILWRVDGTVRDRADGRLEALEDFDLGIFAVGHRTHPGLVGSPQGLFARVRLEERSENAAQATLNRRSCGS